MSTPRASILIPVYNRRDVVCEAIESALTQTVPDLEVIVVDDGSTDGTLDAVRARFGREPRVICVRKDNGGTASARNEGLKRAKGEYVGFLDSDDRYLNAFLERQIAALDAAPEADLALCDVRYVGETRRDGTTVFARRPPPLSIDDMLAGGWYLPVGMLVRREAAVATRFDPEVHCEDSEFLFRFYAAGHEAVLVPEVLAEYVTHAAAAGAPQKSLQGLHSRREMLMFQERFAHLASDPDAHRVRLHRRWTKYLRAADDRKGAHARAAAWWKARPFSPKAAWAWLRTCGR